MYFAGRIGVNFLEGVSVMRIKTLVAAAAMLFGGLFTAAEAVPITYSLNGTIDGSVGTTTLTGAAFTWTITADTAMATPLGPGTIVLPALTSTIDVSGIGMLHTTNGYVFGAVPGADLYAFVSLVSAEELLFGGTPFIAGYDGLTAHAPVLVAFQLSGPIATDQGDFVITDALDHVLVFMAAGGNVPEPVTLALFGAGLAGLGALRRRQQKV